MRLLGAVIVVFAATVSAAEERTPEWLFDHGHIGESRAVSQARLAANPRDAVALAWMARTYTRAGDTKTALTLAERAVAADPDYAGGHLSIAEALGGEARKASVLRRLPIARRIRKALDTAVSLEPRNVAALSGLMRFYLEAPGVAGGSREKADATAARIGAIDAARGFLAQAEIATDRGQRDRVEALHLKAVAANGNNAHARAALAALYVNDRAKQREAEAHAKALRALDAALVEPYQVLAAVYARGRRWNELDAVLAESDRHHPANLAALYAAAQVLRQSGADPARLARYARRYHAQPPEIGAPKTIG